VEAHPRLQLRLRLRLRLVCQLFPSEMPSRGSGDCRRRLFLARSRLPLSLSDPHPTETAATQSGHTETEQHTPGHRL